MFSPWPRGASFAERLQQMNLFHPWHFQSKFPEWLTGLLAVQLVPLPYLTQRRCSVAKENKCEPGSESLPGRKSWIPSLLFFINESQSRWQLSFKGEGINYRESLGVFTHIMILRVNVPKEWHGWSCLKSVNLSHIPNNPALHQCGRIPVIALICSTAGKILIYVLLGPTQADILNLNKVCGAEH